MTEKDLQELRAEIERLLAAALKSDRNHDAAMIRSDQLHKDEMLALADMHDAEIDKLHAEHDQLTAALRTRDVIGMAKGVLISTLGCTAERAFKLLVAQSQAENRKLAEIAAEIVARAQRTRNA